MIGHSLGRMGLGIKVVLPGSMCLTQETKERAVSSGKTAEIDEVGMDRRYI